MTKIQILLNRILSLTPALFVATILYAYGFKVNAQVDIKAVVNGQVITSVEVSERAKILRLTGEGRGNVAKQALEELISDAVGLQEGARWRVNVTQNDIQRAYSNIARSVRMSPSQLNQMLIQNNINPKSLRSRVRAQLNWQQLVRAKARADIARNRVNLVASQPPEESQNRLEKGVAEYDITEIIFVVPRNNQSARSKQQAAAVRFGKSFKGCNEESFEQAKKLKGVVVKRLGPRSADTLTRGIAQQLERVKTGQTTQPFASQSGFTVYAVCAKREIAQRLSAGRPVSNQTPNEETMQKIAGRFRDELRAKALIEYR